MVEEKQEGAYPSPGKIGLRSLKDFTRDLVDLVWIGSAIWYQTREPNMSTYKGDRIWNCTVPVSNGSRVKRVDTDHSGSDPKRIRT